MMTLIFYLLILKYLLHFLKFLESIYSRKHGNVKTNVKANVKTNITKESFLFK